MTINNRMLIVLIPLCIVFGNTVQANDVESSDTTHLGHDYPRKLVANKAKVSGVTVEKKYRALLKRIKASTFPGDKAHVAETARYLISEHKQWESYRDTHCNLISNVYVFPSNSRMWASQFNSCQFNINEERIEFLNGISSEYNK